MGKEKISSINSNVTQISNILIIITIRKNHLMIIIYNNIEIVVFPGWPSIWYGGERWEGGAKKRGRG